MKSFETVARQCPTTLVVTADTDALNPTDDRRRILNGWEMFEHCSRLLMGRYPCIVSALNRRYTRVATVVTVIIKTTVMLLNRHVHTATAECDCSDSLQIALLHSMSARVRQRSSGSSHCRSPTATLTLIREHRALSYQLNKNITENCIYI